MIRKILDITQKTIFIFIVGYALAGCAQINNAIGIKNPIDNNKLSSIISAYGIAESAVIAYSGLPRCTVSKPFSALNICYKRSVLVQAQAYDKQANDAINKAVAWQRANPTLDASAYIDAAQEALDILTAYNASNGVQ